MKKLLSVILCAALIVCIFCSCSEKSTDINAEIKYTYDYHYADVNSSVVRAYEQLCGAVVNGEPQVSFNISMLQDANSLFYTSFPLNCLVESINIADDGTNLDINYKNDIDTHKQLVADFIKETNVIAAECGAGRVSKNEYVLNVYTYIAQTFEDSISYTNAYDAIMNKAGTESAFSSAFEYLLLQGGVNASHIYSMRTTGISFLSIVQIDGVEYLFSPYDESKATEGKGLSCFGMIYEDALNLKSYDYYQYTDGMPVAFDDVENRFSDLRDTKSYSYENGAISAYKADGSTVLLDFS